MPSIESATQQDQVRSDVKAPPIQNLWGTHPEQVLSHITHDLRAPLCAIMGYLDLVGRQVRKSAPPKAVEYLSLARENSQRMNQMVNDMLDMFRFENGQSPLQRKRIPIPSLLDSVRKTFAGLATLKKVRLTYRAVGRARQDVWADPRYLRRALDNLIVNAIKFTPTGGSVQVRVKRQARGTTFEVADTGRGIPPEDRKRIFEKFQQARSSDQGRGYGIGLAVTQSIVEAHQGAIRVESQVGKGSRFIFWIPGDRWTQKPTALPA